MPLEAIEPRRLYRQVADQLRLLIESGEYGVGDRLPTERELAERLGISRPTVREALIALEVEGRIRIRVGSGIYVTAPPADEPVGGEIEGPFELLRARELIESALVREATVKATPTDVAALDAILSRMESGNHPSPETIALDREFHVAVAGILGNAVVTRFVGELFDQRMTPYFARLSEYFETGQTWLVAHAEHRTVRDAIAAGDPAAAEAAMRQHLRQSQLRFQHSFGEDAGMGKAGGRMPDAPPTRRKAKAGAGINGRNET
ncbi:FadR/GntR family transcriptional regulator [Aureimonas sp. AU22]|uniref:FadR/GntR family transcriptional regulator n=1 Tax=Aureimonas sp. AU22 TaxID=1638162 RepID=UPI0007867F0D|nr:FadR/GntR family transcriptional regulator [Aureimonas sp. AU22]